MPSLRAAQQSWRKRRIRRMVGRYYRTPLRYRMARHIPNWYFRYGRYRRIRY